MAQNNLGLRAQSWVLSDHHVGDDDTGHRRSQRIHRPELIDLVDGVPDSVSRIHSRQFAPELIGLCDRRAKHRPTKSPGLDKFERLAEFALEVVGRILALRDEADDDANVEENADSEPSLAPLSRGQG